MGVEIVKTHNSWSKFIENNQGVDGFAVSRQEHITFLLCWLSRYVVCPSSKGVALIYHELAVSLDVGDSFASGISYWPTFIRPRSNSG